SQVTSSERTTTDMKYRPTWTSNISVRTTASVKPDTKLNIRSAKSVTVTESLTSRSNANVCAQTTLSVRTTSSVVKSPRSATNVLESLVVTESTGLSTE